MKEQVYHILTKLYPGFVRDRMKVMLEYAGEDTQVEYWIGKTTIIGLIILLLSTVIGYYFIQPYSAAAILILTSFFLYLMAAYLIVFFKADQRSSAVEKILPSYLHFVAANINSGLTPYQAMKASSRKEFGLLKEELDEALGLSLGAMPFSKSLLATTKKIKSNLYSKFIELFVDGMVTGGKLSALLEDLAKDIIENMDLKKEIATRSKSYILFIVFTVVI
ncbi:MAG: hypothetical protein GF334_11535, partial [Candidatus Altiarchaeales archaeon]|nr:hypothetical protein [Candidatus Altiarchaeales archaeon]